MAAQSSGNTSTGRTIPKVTVTSAASVDNSTVSATQLNNSDILQPSSAEKPRKIVCGIITTITLAVTFVGFTVLARRTFVLYTTFQAPFFLTYFCSIWPIIMFPVCVVAKWLRTRGKLPISSSWREYKAVFSEHDTYRPLSIICKCVAFSFLWVGPWYMFIRALGMISVLDVVILSATYPCFMYLFSWTLLCNTFIAFRIVAILISVTGVVIMVHGSPEGFDHASLWTWGAAMAAVSAMAGAFQKVLIRKWIGEISWGQLALFKSAVALFCLLLSLPIYLVLYFTGAETMDWTQVPWSYISGAAIFLLGFQVIIEFAEAVTYEVFVPLGLLLAIPMCAVAEELWSFPVFNSMEIAATILIIMGFFMVIIPENIHTKISKLIKAKHEEHRKRPERPLSRGARSSPQMVR